MSGPSCASTKLPTALSTELFYQLIQSEIGAHSIRGYSTQSLTKPGENYGGTLLGLTIQLEDSASQRTKTVHLVVKMIPTSPLLYKLFNTPVTFCKEVNFYRLVIPAYEQVLRECGPCRTDFLSIYPRYYGSRLTYDNSEDPSEADNNAVLLLENLKVHGYKMCSQYEGLDLKHTELALQGLANFHALPILLRIKKPDLFASTVSKAARDWHEGMHVEESYSKKWTTTALDAIRSIPECADHVDKVLQFLERQTREVQDKDHTTKPFATLIHRDFWTNNIMFRYDDRDCKTPSDLKIVDFQLTAYDTPVYDLIFFLYTSTCEGVRKNNLEHLLKKYHSSLINCLQELTCDTSGLTFERFIEEFHTYANLEFPRVLILLKVMCAEADKVPDLCEFTGFDHILDGDVGGTVYKRRVKELVLEFIDNGWL